MAKTPPGNVRCVTCRKVGPASRSAIAKHEAVCEPRYVVEHEWSSRDVQSRLFLILDTTEKEFLEEDYHTQREAKAAAQRLNFPPESA